MKESEIRPTGGQAMPGQRRRSILLSALRPIGADSSQEAIVDELRRVILSGEVPPGTSIPVADVAQHFGVSHIPVREALKTLFAEQLVDHRRNFGYAVAKLTWAELKELYIVRGVLEAAAMARAVSLACVDDDLAAQQVLAALDEAMRLNDYRAYHRESRRFHFALLEPCRMHRLLHMLRSVWNVTEPYQPMVHVSGSDRDRLHAEHRQMLAAFVARDVAELTARAVEHQHDLEEAIDQLAGRSEMFAEAPRQPLESNPR
jgi:DNA-binding GntR family transcriptional regulator